MLADADLFIFSELINDYATFTYAIEEVFNERTKIIRNWKNTELTLEKRKNYKAGLDSQKHMDKLNKVNAEIVDLEQTIDKYKKDIEDISKTIRSELERFQKNKAKEYKSRILEYLQKQLEIRQKVSEKWEEFKVQAKAIP